MTLSQSKNFKFLFSIRSPNEWGISLGDFVVTEAGFGGDLGAGFSIPILGDIMRMPGLPEVPMTENMHIDKDGNISGLS